jgi:hypothetical protein
MLSALLSYIPATFPIPLTDSILAINPLLADAHNAVAFFGSIFLILGALYHLGAGVVYGIKHKKSEGYECLRCMLIALGSGILVIILGLYSLLLLPVVLLYLAVRESYTA